MNKVINVTFYFALLKTSLQELISEAETNQAAYRQLPEAKAGVLEKREHFITRLRSVLSMLCLVAQAIDPEILQKSVDATYHLRQEDHPGVMILCHKPGQPVNAPLTGVKLDARVMAPAPPPFIAAQSDALPEPHFNW